MTWRAVCGLLGHRYLPDVDVPEGRSLSAATRYRLRCARCTWLGDWRSLSPSQSLS